VKLYIASRFGNYERVRAFIDDATEAGHEITHDWTRTEEFDEWGHPQGGDGSQLPREEQARHAQADLNAAAAADVVVLLPVPDMGGAYVEVGYALAHGRRVIVAGVGRFLIFWGLPAVEVLPDEAAARRALGMVP
jgi:hypothetical protein